MARLVVFLALVGAGYWYWSGPYQQSRQSSPAAQLQENAQIMQRCIAQEGRMQSAGGLGGLADVGGSGEDAERLCAAKNNLVKRDGQWYAR